MRKVVLYLAISLDGFLADTRGGVDWIDGENPEYQGDYGYGEFIKNVDTVVMGMKTYRQIVTELSPDMWFYSGMQSYILTHESLKNQEEIEFTNEPADVLISRLKEQQGRDIWICGGADVANQLIKADLIDEYHITTMPLLLGSGIRLFDDDNAALALRLVQSKSENGAIDSVYVRRES